LKKELGFQNLKTDIINALVLQYYKPNAELVLSADASQYGLGSVLLQNNLPLAYASCSLNETQQNYSQIEKELLSLVVGCEKHRYFLYGQNFTIQTDHKPLLGILRKPIHTLSPRLQRMIMRLLRYQFTLIHVPGKQMYISDALSRAPLSHYADTKYLEESVHTIDHIITVSDEKMTVLKQLTNTDPILKQLKQIIQNGWPEHKVQCPDICKFYFDKKTDLFIQEDLVFYQNRLIVPDGFRQDMLKILHMPHQGIVSTQTRARNSIYWPGMMKEIHDMIISCDTCNKFSPSQQNQPMTQRQQPTLPWEDIAVDLAHVQNQDYLVLVDYFSKFVEIRQLVKKDATHIIQALVSIFRTHGLPSTLQSDNGPPFDSHAFKNFLSRCNIRHITSSPYYPQSNGMVERTVAIVKQIILKSKAEDVSFSILEHNNTPKQNLMAPAQILMGRTLRTLLPQPISNLEPLHDVNNTRKQLELNNQKSKYYYDRRTRPLPALRLNQNVYVQFNRQWEPGTIIDVSDTPNSYVVRTDTGEFRRNRVQIKPREAVPTKSPVPPAPAPVQMNNVRPTRAIQKPIRFRQ